MSGKANEETLWVGIADDGVISVAGDIDMSGGPILEAAIAEQESTFDPQASDSDIVIDLGDVAFIDSSGLRTLLGAARRTHARGARVVLRRAGVPVQRLLEMTGTTAQFHLENSDG